MPVKASCSATDDGERSEAVLLEIRIGDLGNLGDSGIGIFEDASGQMPFEFLSDEFDFGFDLIQFVGVRVDNEACLKGSGDKIAIFLVFDFTINGDSAIFILGGHVYLP